MSGLPRPVGGWSATTRRGPTTGTTYAGSNGLALCKIHHAAFDQNILGVRPDLVVEVRRDILAEVDGPMLRHGLQEMAGVTVCAPTRRDARPDRARLKERYEQFRTAS